MRFFFALLGLAWSGVASAAPPREGPLPWRVGGRVGFTVDARSFPDSTGYTLEVYVRITPTTIAELARNSAGKGRMRIEARLVGAYGGSRRNASQEFDLDPGDSTGGIGKVVLLRFPTRPGAQRLHVELQDLNSRRKGLMFLGRRVPVSSEVEGELEVPASQRGRDVSDLEFVWAEDREHPAGPFWRSGRNVIPNPERLYGLYAKELRVFFLARGLSGDERSWHWVARLTNAQGQSLAHRESTAAAGRCLSSSFTMDLTREPAGGYDVELKAWQEGDSGALVRRAHFGVAWEPDSWLRNARDVEDAVHFLLPAAEEEAFAVMHPGEQERFLADFWRARDPSPGTPENEARDAFLRRITIANETYRHFGAEPGMFSDMGRVFVRYGEPSEILRQVVPAGDNTLLEIIQQLSIEEDRPLGEVHQKGLGGDIRPFEVWIYEGDIPLPPEADPRLERNSQRRRLVFLFVDEHGMGDYVLRYSTE